MRYKVKIGNKRITSVILKKEWLTMLLLFPFFKTSGFDFIPGLSFVCNAMLMAEFFVFFAIVILEKKGNPFFIMVVIYEAWNYIVAPVIAESTPPSLFYVTGALGLLSVFELGFRENGVRFLNAVCRLFAIMITANLLLLFLFPNGLNPVATDQVHLFGLRVGFSLVIIPGLLFNFVRDKLMKKMSLSTLFCVVAGVLSLVKEWVATGILELMVIAFMLLLSHYHIVVKKARFWMAALGILTVNFVVSFVGTDNFLMRFLAAILRREVTLTGRTYIWEKTIERLTQSPIAGFGLDSATMIFVDARPAHNQWLHFAMEGGYVAMGIMIIAVMMSCCRLSRQKRKWWYGTTCAFFMGILVGCIAEIQTYVPFFYGVFALPYLLENLNCEGNYGTAG